MKILTKTALKEDQIFDRIKKGATDFEIYTASEDIDTLYGSMRSKIDLIKNTNINIYIVHPPIDSEFDIEDLLTNFKKIEDVFFLANEIGKLQKRIIFVILHMNYDLQAFYKFNITGKIFEKLNYLLNTYKNTNIAIENLMAICCNAKRINFKANCIYEASEFVKLFNETTGNNIGTVFDTCHAIATIDLLENYRGIIDDKFIPTLDNYINAFSSTLKIVHLSYSKDFGIGENSHGIAFKEEKEVEILKKIIRSLYIIKFDGFVTLEMCENDYTNSKNWVVTRDNLNIVLERLNIRDKAC